MIVQIETNNQEFLMLEATSLQSQLTVSEKEQEFHDFIREILVILFK